MSINVERPAWCLINKSFLLVLSAPSLKRHPERKTALHDCWVVQGQASNCGLALSLFWGLNFHPRKKSTIRLMESLLYSQVLYSLI